MTNIINIHDRVKETSTSVGVGNFGLKGAVRGFSAFEEAYEHLDNIFYAIIDGSDYEIGSGILHVAGNTEPDEVTPITYTYIERFPFVSTNSNNKVDFSAGIKEVFCTYPATHAVYMGSGIGDLNVPQEKCLAFWASENTLDSDTNITWHKEYKTLGIQNNTPLYGIDIGGDGTTESQIRATGYYAGVSGVFFPAMNGDDSSYPGGRQYKHFIPNETDENLSIETKSELVFEFSGVVNQYLLLKEQTAHYVFAAPVGECVNGACPNGYPEFRLLVKEDIPDLSSIYATLDQLIDTSGVIQDAIEDYVDDKDILLNEKYAAVSGTILDYIDDTNLDLVSNFVAQSGRVDDFIVTASGRIDTLLPRTQHYSSVTIPAIGASTTGVYDFSFDGIVPTNNYTVGVTPNSSLDSLLLTYSYVSSLDTISSVFYNISNSATSPQTLDFNIIVHEVE